MVGRFTYKELERILKCGNVTLNPKEKIEMNGILLPTVDNIIIYKKEFTSMEDTYIIVIDLLCNNKVVARKILDEDEIVSLKKNLVKYIIKVK